MALVVHRSKTGREEAYWVSYIKRRIALQNNFLAATIGPTGSGKSSATLAICEALDPDFTVDNVVFDIEGLLQLVHDGKIDRTKEDGE